MQDPELRRRQLAAGVRTAASRHLGRPLRPALPAGAGREWWAPACERLVFMRSCSCAAVAAVTWANHWHCSIAATPPDMGGAPLLLQGWPTAWWAPSRCSGWRCCSAAPSPCPSARWERTSGRSSSRTSTGHGAFLQHGTRANLVCALPDETRCHSASLKCSLCRVTALRVPQVG